MLFKCLLLAALLPRLADAGLAVVCDQFKIASIVFTSLQCTQPLMTGLNLGSDLGGTIANNDPYYANCNSPHEISSFTVSFTTTTTLSQGGTNYSGRRVILYNPNRSQHSTATLPATAAFSYATTPDPLSFYINMIHDYTHLGTPGTCQTSKRFTIEQELNLVDCRKVNLTAIDLPGLECDMELTGLTIPFGGDYAPPAPFANCILPATANSTSARFQYVLLAGASQVWYTQTDFYSNGGLYANAVPPAFATLTWIPANRPTNVVVNALVQIALIDNTRENNCRFDNLFNFALPWPTPVCPGLSQANCYLNRRGCRWSGSTCLQGAPSTCAQFLTDTVGCTANSNCTLWTNNGNLCTDACNRITPQVCVGSFPVRTHCRLDFTSLACYATTDSDVCYSHPNEATCPSATCFFDPYAKNCFHSIEETAKAFPCTHWSTFTNTPACSYHGCVLLNSNACSTSISTANTLDNSTSINYAQKVVISGSTILPSSTTLRTTIGIPFATSSQPNKLWPTSPSWPNVVISNPAANIGAFIASMPSQCAFRSSLPGPPVETSSQSTAAELQNYVIQWIKTYKTISFNVSSATGVAANAVYGAPLVQPLVTQAALSFDTSTLQFTLQSDLNSIVGNCSQYGASVASNAAGQTFTIPISYVEQLPNSVYYQFVQILTVVVPSTGTATVATATVYTQLGYPIETIFPAEGCAPGSAALQITWQLKMSNIYDSTRQVGPRSVADVSLTSPDVVGPANCYGEQITAFQNLGCVQTDYACYYKLTTLSSCRAAISDGGAFDLCLYANATDKINDVGVGGEYPAGLNGLHRFFVTPYNCPRSRTNDSMCLPVQNNQAGLPDEVRASISTNQFGPADPLVNSFNVQAGFLATPTSTLASLVTLDNTQQFDGNLFAERAISPVLILPEDMRNTHDLRFSNSSLSFVVTPLNGLGQPFAADALAVSQLQYNNIRAGLIYNTKNDFASCSAAQKCELLPACNGVIGCDGFSVPVAYIRQLMPANGYRFSVEYTATLRSTAGARRLLQTASIQGGFLFFDLVFDTTAFGLETCDYEQIKAQVLTEATAISSTQQQKLNSAIFNLVFPLAVLWFSLYFLVSQVAFEANNRATHEI